MIIGSTLVMAVREVRRNTMRSILTGLGIVIGVAAVILMVTIGDSASRKVTIDIGKLGSNLLIVMPGRDGIDVCRELRTRLDVPIIMVTARREEADRVLGFDAGADDYVTKPFSPRELVARIRAVVRRARGTVGPGTKLIVVGAIWRAVKYGALVALAAAVVVGVQRARRGHPRLTPACLTEHRA